MLLLATLHALVKSKAASALFQGVSTTFSQIEMPTNRLAILGFRAQSFQLFWDLRCSLDFWLRLLFDPTVVLVTCIILCRTFINSRHRCQMNINSRINHQLFHQVIKRRIISNFCFQRTLLFCRNDHKKLPVCTNQLSERYRTETWGNLRGQGSV